MNKKTMKKIEKKIKQYDTIVIARHIGPDPDALSSQIALRDVIQNTFPTKKVYAVGSSTAKFKQLGQLDKFSDELYENSLLITVDVPDKMRIDGVNADLFVEKIKIDHHPLVEQFADIEWIDTESSSTAQMVAELILHTNLVLTKEAADKLFLGIVSDSNRFLFSTTTAKTFDIVSNMMRKVNLHLTSLYESLYIRPIKEVRFEGYIANKFTITENGFAYIYISDEIMKEYGVDPASAGNMINNFNYIDEILVWAIFSEDKRNENIRTSIRSRGPVINDVAALFNGGGHDFASGVKLKTMEQVDALVIKLDEKTRQYRESLEIVWQHYFSMDKSTYLC